MCSHYTNLFSFKKEFPNPNDRIAEWNQIQKDYPDYIPIVCEKDPKSNIRDIDKTKYLVPSDLTVAQFSFMIRRRINIPNEFIKTIIINIYFLFNFLEFFSKYDYIAFCDSDN